jgi:hypothetical protein
VCSKFYGGVVNAIAVQDQTFTIAEVGEKTGVSAPAEAEGQHARE